MKNIFFFLLFLSQSIIVFGQMIEKPFVYGETGGFVSNGENAPFWLYSNQFGVFNNNKNCLYARALMGTEENREKKFEVNYGMDLYGIRDKSNNLQFNQLYATFRAFCIIFKGGLYRQVYGNQTSELSSGSVLFSSNARPYPKVSLGIDKYTFVPFTKGYVEIKGEVTHGWAENENRWVRDSYIHYKYVNIRFGGKKPLHFNYGYHHALQWGGVSSTLGRQPSSLKDFVYLFFAKNPPGANVVQSESFNQVGNHMGSRQYGLDYDFKNKTVGLYYQTIFEDKSGSKFISPQGDGLYGLTFKNNDETAHLKEVVLEFTKTTYQSGPIELVWVTDVPIPFWNPKAGNDNYFNNYIYQSWTYKGNTIGTPFITSPAINEKDSNIVTNNRVLAFYFAGLYEYNHLQCELKYSYSINKGTYSVPIGEKGQHSMMFKVGRDIPSLKDLHVQLCVGWDKGAFLGNSFALGVCAKKKF